MLRNHIAGICVMSLVALIPVHAAGPRALQPEQSSPGTDRQKTLDEGTVSTPKPSPQLPDQAPRLPFQGVTGPVAQPKKPPSGTVGDIQAGPPSASKSDQAGTKPKKKTSATKPAGPLPVPQQPYAGPPAGPSGQASVQQPRQSRSPYPQTRNLDQAPAGAPRLDAMGRSHTDYSNLPRTAPQTPPAPSGATSGSRLPTLPPALPYVAPRQGKAGGGSVSPSLGARGQTTPGTVSPDRNGNVMARVPGYGGAGGAYGGTPYPGQSDGSPRVATPPERQYTGAPPGVREGSGQMGGFVLDSFGAAQPSPRQATGGQQPAATGKKGSSFLDPLGKIGSGLMDGVSKIIPIR